MSELRDVPVDLSQYPPPQHMLRDLALEFEHGDDGASRAWLPIDERVCTPQGHLRTGMLATAVDAIGGGMAAMAAAPEGWIATADLTLHVVAPIDGSRLEIRGQVARAGRTTIVLSADVVDATASASGAPPLALATMTFSVLERRDSNPVVTRRADGEPAVRQMMEGDGRGFAIDAYDALGFVTRAPGVVELELVPYVGNSLGALNGGVLGALADAAAASAMGDGFETVDLQMYYLALAKQGPVRARAEVVARGDAWGTAAVEIVDVGAERRTTVVTATAVQW
jgi:uncharacterized protein (TIGR00369 family)